MLKVYFEVRLVYFLFFLKGNIPRAFENKQKQHREDDFWCLILLCGQLRCQQAVYRSQETQQVIVFLKQLVWNQNR